MPDILIAGDFNLPHIDWENDSFKAGISKNEKIMGNFLSDFMSDYNLLQLISRPTYKNGNVLLTSHKQYSTVT